MSQLGVRAVDDDQNSLTVSFIHSKDEDVEVSNWLRVNACVFKSSTRFSTRHLSKGKVTTHKYGIIRFVSS